MGHDQEHSHILQGFRNFKENLDSRGIATSTAEMTTAAVARMYDSNNFMDEKMID